MKEEQTAFDHVLAGLGVPKEFVLGDTTYSTASVAMRMLGGRMAKDEHLQGLIETTQRLLVVLTDESGQGMMGWKVALGDVMTQLARLMPPEIVQKVADEKAEKAESGLPKNIHYAFLHAEEASNTIARAALVGDKEKIGSAVGRLDYNLEVLQREVRRRFRAER